MTTLILSIPDALARRLGRLSRQDGTAVGKLAVEAIETFVTNMEPFAQAALEARFLALLAPFAKKGGKHESKD